MILAALGLSVTVVWLWPNEPVVITIALTIIMIGVGISMAYFGDYPKPKTPAMGQQPTIGIPSVEIVIKKLIEELPIGIMYINPDEEIRFVNSVWHGLINVQGDLRLADFKGHPGLWSAINRAIGTEDEVEYLWPLGAKFYQISIKPIHAEGHFIGVLVTGSDVSGFKNVERMQQDFLADVTHELKTPIAALIGASEILTTRPDSLSEEQTKEFHDIVATESNRLNRLIDDLIELTRIGTTSLKLMKALIPLVTLIEESARHFAADMERKGLTLTIDVPQDLAVFVDHGRFVQVLDNLFSNSIRYTESGGITIDASVRDKTIVISFADTGMGIPEQQLPLIFNRFYRTDEARSRYEGGSGLGLAIVKEIVQSHRGTIEVSSKVGVGSRFFIHIPKI